MEKSPKIKFYEAFNDVFGSDKAKKIAQYIPISKQLYPVLSCRAIDIFLCREWETKHILVTNLNSGIDVCWFSYKGDEEDEKSSLVFYYFKDKGIFQSSCFSCLKKIDIEGVKTFTFLGRRTLYSCEIGCVLCTRCTEKYKSGQNLSLIA